MAAKKHIVKINEEQYSYLKLDKNNGDAKQFDGNSTISVGGKLNREEDANAVTGDKISRAFTPQAWTYYRTPQRGRISEGEHLGNGDNDRDGIDDNYEVTQANVLTNGNDNDNNTIVPQGILTKLNLLIQAMKSQSLNYMQKANIVNKFLESIDFSDTPYRIKKEERLEIN